MELLTYIENYSSAQIPPFKHPTKFTNPTNSDEALDQLYSPNVSIPDKIILSNRSVSTEFQQSIKCFLLYGYQLKLKDWENIRNLYPDLIIKIKLYRGSQVSNVSENVLNAKSFLKGQKKINQPLRSLIRKDQKSLQSCIHIYVVEISNPQNPNDQRILYYLPSLFDTNLAEYPLQCLKSRYFNHKILQILNEYVSLDNNSTTCYKDLAHHQFQTIVYSGKVSSFEILIKLKENSTSPQVTESFLEKLSQISMTDKHLLDEVDPLDFSEIKKQIRAMYLEQKRIRKSLTLQKLKIVQQVQNTLEFLNLKEVYPQKLNYNTITSQMLKRIRSQNIDNKAIWIKEQNFILKNLDARIIDLQNTKSKFKKNLLQQEKSNYQQIQELRNQIKYLQTSIKYEQAERGHQIDLQNKIANLNLNNRALNSSKAKALTRIDSQSSKVSQNQGLNSHEKNQKKNETIRTKNELEELEKAKILKNQMLKAEFQMQKQFVRRKAQYAKAAEEIFSYLIDC